MTNLIVAVMEVYLNFELVEVTVDLR